MIAIYNRRGFRIEFRNERRARDWILREMECSDHDGRCRLGNCLAQLSDGSREIDIGRWTKFVPMRT